MHHILAGKTAALRNLLPELRELATTLAAKWPHAAKVLEGEFVPCPDLSWVGSSWLVLSFCASVSVLLFSEASWSPLFCSCSLTVQALMDGLPVIVATIHSEVNSLLVRLKETLLVLINCMGTCSALVQGTYPLLMTVLIAFYAPQTADWACRKCDDSLSQLQRPSILVGHDNLS